VHEHGFNRLVRVVDELAGQGAIHDVFIQTGFSTYLPKYCKWCKAIDFSEFEKGHDKLLFVFNRIKIKYGSFF
jgi:hypothetical protein